MEDEKIKYSNKTRSLYNKAKLLSELLKGVEISKGLTFNGYRLGLLHDIRSQSDKEGDITFFCNADDTFVINVKVSVTIDREDLINLNRENFYKLMVLPTCLFNAVEIRKRPIGEIILEEI